MQFIGCIKRNEGEPCKIKYSKKDGSVKTGPTSEEAYNYCLKNFKKDDYFATGENGSVFKEGILEKAVKFVPKKKLGGASGSGGAKSSYNDKSRQTSIIRQVLFKGAIELKVSGDKRELTTITEELDKQFFNYLSDSGEVSKVVPNTSKKKKESVVTNTKVASEEVIQTTDAPDEEEIVIE